MAAKSARPPERPATKSVASIIREAIERNGYKDVKECARSIKVPYDLFNKVVGGHIPKDAQLLDYAKKLDLDSRELILAAYREKAPDEMKQYFNSVQLLEDHNPTIREITELMDACNADQLEQLVQVARFIRSSPRDYCRKATALLRLYQHLPLELAEHLDSLILLALRNESATGLKEFREAIDFQRTSRAGRRGRLHN
jgi:hypothetical protein